MSSVIKVRILGDNKGLAGALSDSESKLRGFASGAAKIVTGAAVAAGAAVGTALVKGLSDAISDEAGVDLLQAQLGLSEEEAGRIGEVASTAYRNAWGDSLADVQNTVAVLDTSFEDLGSDRLGNLTKQAEAISDVFGTEVEPTVQSASELVSSGLAGSAEEAFDLLTEGLRKMPAGIRDELFAASNEYGDFFADLGFTGTEAFGLLTDAAEDGVFGIDKTGDALKELTIRATDMSTASMAAYETAGLDGEEMAAKILAGGDTAREGFDEIVAGLAGIEDPVDQANAAIALFGTPLEDLSVSEIPDFLDSLADVGAGLGDVEGSADDLADTVSDNASAKIEAFKRKALGGLADFTAEHLLPRLEEFGEWLSDVLPPIIADVRAWFERNWPAIQRTMETVFDWLVNTAWPIARDVFNGIRDAVQAVVDWVRDNWPTIQEVVARVVEFFEDVVAPVISEVVGFLVEQFDGVVEWVRENWPKIQETVRTVMNVVRTSIETVLNIIRELWDRFGDNILAAVESTWETVKSLIDGAMSVIKGVIEVVMGIITLDWDTAWGGIKRILSGVWEAMSGIVTGTIEMIKLALSNAWIAIKGVASVAWDGIRLAIKGYIDLIVSYFTDLPNALLDLLGRFFAAARDLGKSIVRGIGEGLIGIGRAITAPFKAAWNAVARLWNSTVGNISISVPDWVPGIGGNGFDMPNLPTLHSGGFVGDPNGPARDVPIMAQQGEYVLSRDDVANGLGGDVIVLPIMARPDDLDLSDPHDLMVLGQRLRDMGAVA